MHLTEYDIFTFLVNKVKHSREVVHIYWSICLQHAVFIWVCCFTALHCSDIVSPMSVESALESSKLRPQWWGFATRVCMPLLEIKHYQGSGIEYHFQHVLDVTLYSEINKLLRKYLEMVSEQLLYTMHCERLDEWIVCLQQLYDLDNSPPG